MKTLAIIACTAAATAALTTPAFAGKQGRVDLQALVNPVYTVEGDAFVRHNGDRYSNRPLYCNHLYAVVLAGDKPYSTLGHETNILGNLMFALVRDGRGKWLQHASDITSRYRPGRMEWTVKDEAWGETVVHLEVVPAAVGAGLAARVRVEGTRSGDTVVWASGGATIEKQSVLWEDDVMSMPGHIRSPLVSRGFVSADCERNEVAVTGYSWTLQAVSSLPVATGQCSVRTPMCIADAEAWKDPAALITTQGYARPVACGTLVPRDNEDVYWSLLAPGAGVGEGPAEEFAAGMRREEAIQARVVVDTPDPWLNAAVGACSNVEDACFRDSIYTHSGMRWSKALLGWRTLFGGTVFGSHENVKTQAAYCIGEQIKESDLVSPKADARFGLSREASESRLFGKGRVDVFNPPHYDMQSQFFDQVEHAWRWTGDAELERLLRPSLDLHCEYIKDCFDPAGLGIYESYANTWPTDDQWYNGGGTSEETAYAYQAERTALQLAQRAGDHAGAQRHAANAERIRKGFFDLLWVPQKGHPGAYREQGGLKRLHESGWLYSIFCPIDAGLLSLEQAAEALHYSEWALERMPVPYGGEQCWPSNWVPSIWSVREMWPGDDYHLALAYFQTGLPDEGWKVFRGMFPQQLLFGGVPGDMGHPAGGTDFNDCNSMFARAVVEGLFGYRPDYPQNLVTIAPQLPSDWDHASIKTPDVSLSYRRDGTHFHCEITLAKPCAMRVQLPVSTTGIAAVTVDGAPAKWQLLPGFGRSLVQVDLPTTGAARVDVTTRDLVPSGPSVRLAGNVGEPHTLVDTTAAHGRIVDFHDPEGVLRDGKVADGSVAGTLTANAGDHLVFGLTQLGDTQQWRMFKIHVTDAEKDRDAASKINVEVPPGARFDPIDLQPVFNGDIRTIYQQPYLSPRPKTCSLRLASDGYSSWQMTLGGPMHPPGIGLENVRTLSDGSGNILAGKGIPFRAPGEGKNVAFTSRWDNWPSQATVPVNQTGRAAWFLLCGSTNPMQVRIPNAELRLTYADGVVEKLEIIPPFNFWTLCPFGGNDYDYQRDGFALPKVPPTTVQLGKNCRAVVLGWNLRPGVPLQSVTLETLSQEVVIGLMGVTMMN